MDRLDAKRKRHGFLVLLISTILFACGHTEKTLPPSTGKPGELLIIIDTAQWNGPVGKSLIGCFNEIQPGLPQGEPYFDILHIVPRAFTNIFQTTSNILMLDIGRAEKARYVEQRNVWAKDQLFVKIEAKNGEQAAEIINKNQTALLHLFRDSEIQRQSAKIKKVANVKLKKSWLKEQGIKIDMPNDFKKVSSSDHSFYYRRDKEKQGHSLIQGLQVYIYPYRSEEDLDVKSMVNKRNSITQKTVLGSKKGQYMKVYEDYEPDERVYEHKGNYMKEIRGLWKMNNAFMGGPFVNYALIDEKRARIIGIDGYVFGPKFDKREYLKELEVIARSVEIIDKK